MKYLIDIGHPAHVHYFKNFALIKQKNQHEVLFTCRDKDVSINLLEHYNFNYINLGKGYKSKPGKLFGLIYFTIKLLHISLKFKPDLILNATISAAFISWLMRKPHISLEDTFNNEQVKLYLPFTNCVITGSYKHPEIGHKEIKISGYQELMYLHPNHFNPDPGIVQRLGIEKGCKYVILRFVSWNASHDFGHKGMSLENKIRAVKSFSKYAKVFISSEARLPEELIKYEFKLPPPEMHHALAFSSLVYGESATMATEAAMLGVPGIYLDNTGRFYTQDLEENHGLVYNYSESDEHQKLSIDKGIELLNSPNNQKDFSRKRKNLLNNKIDVTSFLDWFVTEWPRSFTIMKNTPDYQNKFIEKIS